MDTSEIDFKKLVFPLGTVLFEVSDGNIDDFEHLVNIVGQMTFEDDFSFSDVNRLIKANRGFKKSLNRKALNDNFIKYVLPLIKKCLRSDDSFERNASLILLEGELKQGYWESISMEDLIEKGYEGKTLDFLLPMSEINVRTRFNEGLEVFREYVKQNKEKILQIYERRGHKLGGNIGGEAR